MILLRLLNISVPTLIVLKCETLSREGEEAEGLVALQAVVVCTPCEVKTEALEEKLSNLMPSSFVPLLTRDLKAGTLFLHQYCCLDHPEHSRCIAGNKNSNLACLQKWHWLDLSGSVVARTSGTSSNLRLRYAYPEPARQGVCATELPASLGVCATELPAPGGIRGGDAAALGRGGDGPACGGGPPPAVSAATRGGGSSSARYAAGTPERGARQIIVLERW